MHRTIALFLLFPFFLTACGSSSHSADTASESISGNWQMTLQPADTTSAPRSQSGFLLQNGNTITGQLMLTDPPCSGTGNVSGSMSGSSVSMAIDPTGVSVSLTGTVGSNPNSMSGNYTILSSGCTGNNSSPDTGTWTASLVAPLNGNFQGTFTRENGTGSYSFAGTVTQGPNTGSLDATLSGTLNVTAYNGATAQCFTGGTLSGVASGTSAVMNLLDSNGNQIAEMYGTTSLDGSSMTGTFVYEGQGPTGIKGCKASEAGPVCVIWQPSGQTNCSISSDLSARK